MSNFSYCECDDPNCDRSIEFSYEGPDSYSQVVKDYIPGSVYVVHKDCLVGNSIGPVIKTDLGLNKDGVLRREATDETRRD